MDGGYRLNQPHDRISASAARDRAYLPGVSIAVLFCVMATARQCAGQIPFSTAVEVAVRTNPRMLMAQDDVARAEAVVKEAKDVYLPSVIANGGAGDSHGITLNVPTIFTANAQSLIYSASQRDSIRAAEIDRDAARRRVSITRAEVEEDTIAAYLDLNHAQQKVAMLEKQVGVAREMLKTTQHRATAGIASDQDVQRTRRDALAVQLEQLEAEDQVVFFRGQLAGLLGVRPEEVLIDSASIPSLEFFRASGGSGDVALPESAEILDAQARAAAAAKRAAADRRVRWLPQISFAAQYGRISPINGVSDFYNIHGKYNTFFGGVTIQFPLLDKVQRDHARQTEAEAAHAAHSLEQIEAEDAGPLRARHAIAELGIKAELAEMDLANAERELNSIRTQIASGAAGRPIATPVDEDRAVLHVEQLDLEKMDADEDLLKAQISFLRLTGQLEPLLKKLTASPSSP